ncbi:hypothetical protein CEXT_691231 [Caerostris extrusa]|uniref:Uncharacterized protein n=1 Tax=Caerostris extrusa TaxID=172846 RepID=A0AAV4WZA7_CAEEX|nr:hypothetical protein CEXT_691231 [Caerostris extrusa]
MGIASFVILVEITIQNHHPDVDSPDGYLMTRTISKRSFVRRELNPGSLSTFDFHVEDDHVERRGKRLNYTLRMAQDQDASILLGAIIKAFLMVIYQKLVAVKDLT